MKVCLLKACASTFSQNRLTKTIKMLVVMKVNLSRDKDTALESISWVMELDMSANTLTVRERVREQRPLIMLLLTQALGRAACATALEFTTAKVKYSEEAGLRT